MKNTNKKVGIIGLGLIGGSLALKLASQGFNIVCIVRNKSSISADHPFTLVSENCSDLHDCDFVFICTPLSLIVETLTKIQPYLKPSAIVTDVGSVKGFICEAAEEIMRKDCTFIGSHPMAGTEKSGFVNAFCSLFEGRPWAIMNHSNKAAHDELTKLIELTDAKIIFSEPNIHDQAVSLISHLPLLLSIGLLNTVDNIQDPNLKEISLALASSGYEGMVRLAKGNQTLNKDLLNFNSDNVKKAFEIFTHESGEIIKKLNSV